MADGTYQTKRLSFSGCLALLLVAAFIAYTVTYLLHSHMPANMPPDGWFAAWDQGQYRKAALNVTQWRFDNTTTFYPPLFPWLGAPFVRWIPDHAYFVPSFICLAIYLAGLATIGARYFGRVSTYGVLVVMFAAFPKLTIEQWVIPWTSSGVGALTSILFLLFDRERLDRRTVAAFFLSYGAVFATRPLDVVPLFPLAVAMAWRTLLPLRRETLRLIPIITLCGLAFPALYLGLNWRVEGDPFGGYIRISRGLGLTASPQHVIANLLAIQGYCALFFPALAFCAVSLFRAPTTIRLIAAAVLINIIAYTAYTDLTPQNIYASNMVHYFKWAMPWLALIAVGQLADWIRRGAWSPIWATALASVLLLSIRFELAPVRSAEARFAKDTVAFTDAAPLRLDAIDVVGVQGRTFIMSLDNELVEGDDNVRLIGIPYGTRFFFPRGLAGRSFSITFREPFTTSDPIEVIGGKYSFTSTLVPPKPP
jgi:hypothetical protein